jgi:outer membrane protein OmpA-like peptidoglycan-associated protein
MAKMWMVALGSSLALAWPGMVPAGAAPRPGPAASGPAERSTTQAASDSTAWFHDPESAAERRAEIKVPAHPKAYAGPLRHTEATMRTHSGSLAVPVAWADGHDLIDPEAVVLDGAGLFLDDGSNPTGALKAAIALLDSSLDRVRALQCQGNTDYSGAAAANQSLSKKRAQTVCSLLHGDNPDIPTSSAGYGGDDPVVVGGTAAERPGNARVVVVVTASAVIAPDAPVLTGAVAGDTTARLSFDPPASDGGAGVSSYQVSTDGGAAWRALTVDGAGPFRATVGRLTDGVTYAVEVRAVNRIGASRASNGRRVTPIGVPGAPDLLAVVAGDTTALVTFAPPDFTGGTEVTGYDVSTNDGTTWHAVPVSGATPYSTTISGLRDGTRYLVAVRATNRVGPGPSSNELAVTPIMAIASPDAPVLVTVTPGDTTATLVFAAPLFDGGSPVTGYEASTDGGVTWNPVATSGSDPLTATLTGLTDGATYAVEVEAVNAAGDSVASNEIDVTPFGLPDAPMLSAVTPGDTTAGLVFAAPLFDGGSPVTGYEASTDGGATWVPLTTAGPDPFTATLTGLTDGTTYPVTVRALNAAGDSVASNSVNVTPIALPGPPVITLAAPVIVFALPPDLDSNYVDLSFTAPTSDGGSAIIGYQVQSTSGGDWTDLSYIAGAINTATVQVPACPAPLYSFAIRSVNANGVSIASNVYPVLFGETCS